MNCYLLLVSDDCKKARVFVHDNFFSLMNASEEKPTLTAMCST
jgi:hypothetical protein